MLQDEHIKVVSYYPNSKDPILEVSFENLQKSIKGFITNIQEKKQ